MTFVDEARLRVWAGDGGDGCSAFLREKYRPKGGPAGGDGGDGGSIIAIADAGMSTLLDYRYKDLIKADRGENGSGKSRHGAAARDTVLTVPVGTLIIDESSGETIADLTRPGQEAVLVYGGRGGRGNARFATSVNQAPRRADPGTPGEKRNLRLELRLLADVGVIGLPNAGKSSLVARVSAAKPKIGAYPFTSLAPTLGVVKWNEDGGSFVIADLPGLIEGAHEGHGLGLQFLKHVSRSAMLLHLLDASMKGPEQVMRDFDAVNAELESYSPQIVRRPQVVAMSKLDLPESAAMFPELKRYFEQRGLELLALSSATGEGCREIISMLGRKVVELRARQAEVDPGSAATD